MVDRVESVVQQSSTDASETSDDCVARATLAMGSAAMITDGLGERTVLWPGGHWSRAAK